MTFMSFSVPSIDDLSKHADLTTFSHSLPLRLTVKLPSQADTSSVRFAGTANEDDRSAEREDEEW